MSTREAIRAVVTRRFHASANQVFDAWLNRALLGEWMFGPAVRDEEIIHLSLTPKVGGSFSFLVERGQNEIEHVGRYLEISRPCRLVFTWTVTTDPVGSRVIVEIEPGQTGCELTLTHELHPSCAEQVGRTEEAWGKMFDALATALGEGSS
jgi:uncharacterized protein YndB with AHSA1/START domain